MFIDLLLDNENKVHIAVKNEIIKFADRGIELEKIILLEKAQTQQDQHHSVPSNLLFLIPKCSDVSIQHGVTAETRKV